MPVNVGTWDRIARIVVGLVLIALAALGTIGAWGYVGIVLLVTGAAARCPAYRVFGLNTCPVAPRR